MLVGIDYVKVANGGRGAESEPKVECRGFQVLRLPLGRVGRRGGGGREGLGGDIRSMLVCG